MGKPAAADSGLCLVTERLSLAPHEAGDAGFVIELLNEPGFRRCIGDKGVRSVSQALAYLEEGPLSSYARFGYGLLRVSLRSNGAAAGICGLVSREGLDAPDLGFAFLERFWSRGYAVEASRAVLEHARRELGIERILALADPDNAASVRVLAQLGFVREGCTRLPGESSDVDRYCHRPG